MKQENNKFGEFLEKMKFKYRLTILNEDTLEEVRRFRLSRFTVFMGASLLALAYFVIISLLVVVSPLKNYLPGYTDTKTRTEAIYNAIRLDSLSNQLEMQNQYLEAVKGVLSGEIKADSIVPIDSIARYDVERIPLEKGEKEKEFIRDFNRK